MQPRPLLSRSSSKASMEVAWQTSAMGKLSKQFSYRANTLSAVDLKREAGTAPVKEFFDKSTDCKMPTLALDAKYWMLPLSILVETFKMYRDLSATILDGKVPERKL